MKAWLWKNKFLDVQTYFDRRIKLTKVAIANSMFQSSKPPTLSSYLERSLLPDKISTEVEPKQFEQIHKAIFTRSALAASSKRFHELLTRNMLALAEVT